MTGLTDRKKPFRGKSIAIVGADGCGKSTIAHLIVASAPASTRYLYMGASIEASRIALPTSRLLVWLKRRRLGSKIDAGSPLPPAAEMTDDMKSRLRGGALIKALGVINRIAEEWYRQLHLWGYTVRGYRVVCDRHFLYEYFPDSARSGPKTRPLSVRLHDGLLTRCFPRPHLTVFLDAPADVLYSRKPEWSPEHIERQRAGIAEQGQAGGRFVRINADRSVDEVLADVVEHIERLG